MQWKGSQSLLMVEVSFIKFKVREETLSFAAYENERRSKYDVENITWVDPSFLGLIGSIL